MIRQMHCNKISIYFCSPVPLAVCHMHRFRTDVRFPGLHHDERPRCRQAFAWRQLPAVDEAAQGPEVLQVPDVRSGHDRHRERRGLCHATSLH